MFALYLHGYAVISGGGSVVQVQIYMWFDLSYPGLKETTQIHQLFKFKCIANLTHHPAKTATLPIHTPDEHSQEIRAIL